MTINYSPSARFSITGIDVRKKLLAAGVRPSDYDEQRLFDYLNNHALPILQRIDLTSPEFMAIASLFHHDFLNRIRTS